MQNNHAITKQQRAILEQFTCERLTANPRNHEDIRDFTSELGEGLADTLKLTAWTSDLNGTIAYYLIRNPEGRIVLYFSLKCGMLFDPDYAQAYLDAFRDQLEQDEAAKRWVRLVDGDESEAAYFHNQSLRMGRVRFDDFVESVRIKSDKKLEPNKKIIRTRTAIPAIELVEFCANDATRDCWAGYGFPKDRKMGETLFWWFVVPKMMEINALIGCKYVYLFAADKNVSGSLSNYYRDRLHFTNMTHLGTVKPSYDLHCFFMGRQLRDRSRAGLSRFALSLIPPEELLGLEHYQKAFFADFNRPPEPKDPA